MPGQVVGIKSVGYTQSKRRYPAFIEGNNLSAGEQLTGQTWIDGSPIYRKIISFPNGPNFLQLVIPHNITPAPTNVIGLYGTMINLAGTDFIPIPNVGQNVNENLSLQASDTSIFITPDQTLGADWSSFHGFIVIEYIK